MVFSCMLVVIWGNSPVCFGQVHLVSIFVLFSLLDINLNWTFKRKTCVSKLLFKKSKKGTGVYFNKQDIQFLPLTRDYFPKSFSLNFNLSL